jgi:site-specific recombinase XerD
VVQGVFAFMARKTDKQPVTQLDRDITAFLFDREARNLSKKTLLWYSHSLKLWRNYNVDQGLESTTALEPIHLRGFLVYLTQTGHNEGGVHTIFGAVRGYLNWYGEEYAPIGWANPLTKVKIPKRSDEVEPPISLEDFKKLLDTCQPGLATSGRDKALLLFLLDSGVRHQELADLLIGDVDLRIGQVIIRRGKGRKTRTVYIGSRTRRALTSYLRLRPKAGGQDSLWLTLTGKRLTKSGIRQILARRAKKAGIKEPGLHEFRRAFAINYLRNGGDVITLQRLLGHANLSIINRYLAFVDEDLRKSHEKHGVVDNLAG